MKSISEILEEQSKISECIIAMDKLKGIADIPKDQIKILRRDLRTLNSKLDKERKKLERKEARNDRTTE